MTDIAALKAQNEALLAQVAELQADLAELAEMAESTLADNDVMGKVFDSDDRLATAVAELKKLTELDRVMKTRMGGLLEEKNAMIRVAKGWQRRAQRAERELAALHKQASPVA